MGDEEHLLSEDTKELIFLREQVRTNGQIFEIVYGLSSFMIFAGVLYWISSLAMIGARYVYSDFYSIQLAQVMVYSFSILILLFYFISNISTCYSTLSEDSGIGFREFKKKFQAASEAWVKSRKELEENYTKSLKEDHMDEKEKN